MCIKGLTTSFIVYPPTECLALLPTSLLHFSWLFCISQSVCWGGVFDARALTRGKSGADMKHIRQGSACDATAASRKCFTPCSSIGLLMSMKTNTDDLLQHAKQAVRSACRSDVAEPTMMTLYLKDMAVDLNESSQHQHYLI